MYVVLARACEILSSIFDICVELGGVPWVQNIGSNLTGGRPKISDALLVQSMEWHTLKNVNSC